jgi:Acetyltransferase (GNAT) domain
MSEPSVTLRAENGVQIRQARLADRDALIELSRVVFQETGTDKIGELGADFWEWQFAQQPGNRMGVWLAEFEGQIVGQLPTNIVRMKWGSRERLAALVIDLMVHPAHRNKSLFVKLCRVANVEMTNTGIGISAGLPNKNSYASAVRFLKYHPVCQIPLLILPLRWGRLLAQAKIPKGIAGPLGALAAAGRRLTILPGPTSGSVSVREVTQFPEAIDELWERVSGVSGVPGLSRIWTVRDRAYLTWRYSQCPTRTYRIYLAEADGKLNGYLVTRTFVRDGLKTGAVMDLLVEPGHREAANALIASAVTQFRVENVDAAIALMQRDELLYPALVRRGFFRIPERFNPRTFNFVCRVLAPELPEREFYNPQSWFLTLGDYDVY